MKCLSYLCYNTIMKESVFKKKELVIIAIILLASAIPLLFLLNRDQGNIAVVTYNGEIVSEISLDKSGIYYIYGDLPVTLEVKNGRIRFINSVCPDHICEGYGWIGDEYDCAICMPARVSVQIKAR